MRIKLHFILVLFSLNTLNAQINLTTDCNANVSIIDNNSNKDLNEYKVFTRFGPIQKSNVNYIPQGYHLRFVNNYIQLISNHDSVVIKEFGYNLLDKKEKTRDIRNIEDERRFNNFLNGSLNGWISDTYCYVLGENPKPPNIINSQWKVPAPPQSNSNQTIYLFIGLQTSDSGILHLVQPVLQWGPSPAGGGKFWSICNWYVLSNNLFFHDSLMQVSPGTLLNAEIKLLSMVDNKFSYRSSFLGFPSGLEIENLPRLETPHVVFEGYNITNSNELPFDEKVNFNNISIETDSVYPRLIWFTNTINNSFGIFSEIINESSQNGEVAIHFHRPYDIDNFKEIHLYPNPIESFLHVSPNRPIYNCYVEIYNVQGYLISKEFYPMIDSEFNLDISFVKPGLFIIKFSFYKSLNSTDRVMHSFKFIKK